MLPLEPALGNTVGDKLEEKILPVVEGALEKYLGVRIEKLEVEVSNKIRLVWRPFVDTNLKYKEAKRLFRTQYVTKVLSAHFGNVAEVARLLGVNRRTLHRLLASRLQDVRLFRQELHREEYFRTEAVKGAFQSVLPAYSSILHPERIRSLYSHADDVSRQISGEVPFATISLGDADDEFDNQYITTLLNKTGSVTKAARLAGIRAETLHRKIAALRILKKI